MSWYTKSSSNNSDTTYKCLAQIKICCTIVQLYKPCKDLQALHRKLDSWRKEAGRPWRDPSNQHLLALGGCFLDFSLVAFEGDDFKIFSFFLFKEIKFPNCSTQLPTQPVQRGVPCEGAWKTLDLEYNENRKMRQLKRNRPWKVEQSEGPNGFSSVVCLFAVTFGVVLVIVFSVFAHPSTDWNICTTALL